jgi:hypothetical protein
VSNPPATFYGSASAGDVIEAQISGRPCVQAEADATGFWMMQVPEGGACGATAGATVRFLLNGVLTEAREVWQAGGAPADIVQGVDLVRAPGPVSG